jgi:2-dehydropantoate 2-reductase
LYIDVTLAMGPVKTSMWQDIDAGHKTEVDFLNGYVAAKSVSMHLSAPVNQCLTTLAMRLRGVKLEAKVE